MGNMREHIVSNGRFQAKTPTGALVTVEQKTVFISVYAMGTWSPWPSPRDVFECHGVDVEVNQDGSIHWLTLPTPTPLLRLDR